MKAGGWFISGAVSGGALVAVTLHFAHAPARAPGESAVTVPPASSMVLTPGQPASQPASPTIGSASSAAGPAAGPAMASPGAPSPAPGAAPTMDSAVASLQARLASKGGTAGEWMLLAQGYDFLGRPEEARRARAQAGNPSQAVPVKNPVTLPLQGGGGKASAEREPSAPRLDLMIGRQIH